MTRQHRCLVFLALSIASCAAPTYRPEVPLTDQTFQSSDGAFTGRVPQGWFVSTDSELAPHLSAWLMRDDYAAALTFQEININPAIVGQVDNKGLGVLAELSFRFKQAEEPSAKMLMKPQEFTLREKSFCRYEYTSDRQPGAVSVVLFRLNPLNAPPKDSVGQRATTRYYESVILQINPDRIDVNHRPSQRVVDDPTRRELSTDEPQRLLNTQRAVLASLEQLVQ